MSTKLVGFRDNSASKNCYLCNPVVTVVHFQYAQEQIIVTTEDAAGGGGGEAAGLCHHGHRQADRAQEVCPTGGVDHNRTIFDGFRIWIFDFFQTKAESRFQTFFL